MCVSVPAMIYFLFQSSSSPSSFQHVFSSYFIYLPLETLHRNWNKKLLLIRVERFVSMNNSRNFRSIYYIRFHFISSNECSQAVCGCDGSIYENFVGTFRIIESEQTNHVVTVNWCAQAWHRWKNSSFFFSFSKLLTHSRRLWIHRHWFKRSAALIIGIVMTNEWWFTHF